MSILQLYVEDDDVVQTLRQSIDVPDDVPKYDVDDVSYLSLLPLMLCRATPVVVQNPSF